MGGFEENKLKTFKGTLVHLETCFNLELGRKACTQRGQLLP